MSGTPSDWGAGRRIVIAEQEHYGHRETRFDPTVQRYRTLEAVEDPNYNSTEKILPADRPVVRIIHTLEDVLSSGDSVNIQRSAGELENIALSCPAKEWHSTYLTIVGFIDSTAKRVDGEAASMNLARLVAALASRDDFVTTTGSDLTYDIGDYWVRSVVFPPGAPLAGESDFKIWSQMPSLQLWIHEELRGEYYTQRCADIGNNLASEYLASFYPVPEDRLESFEPNYLRFCGGLSRMYVEGHSPISSFHPDLALPDLHYGLEPLQTDLYRLKWAATYMDIFGEEIYQLCVQEFSPD